MTYSFYVVIEQLTIFCVRLSYSGIGSGLTLLDVLPDIYQELTLVSLHQITFGIKVFSNL